MGRLTGFLRDFHRHHGTSGYILKFDVRSYYRNIDHAILRRLFDRYFCKEYLRECLAQMRDYVWRERGLEFNQKTQIVPLSQGVDYLGFHFYLTDTGKVVRRLRTANKKRMKAKLKRYRGAYRAGTMSLEQIDMSVASYCAHLRYGHTWHLKENMLRHLVLSKSTREQLEWDKAHPQAYAWDTWDDELGSL